jgi:hypothetical protein
VEVTETPQFSDGLVNLVHRLGPEDLAVPMMELH